MVYRVGNFSQPCWQLWLTFILLCNLCFLQIQIFNYRKDEGLKKGTLPGFRKYSDVSILRMGPNHVLLDMSLDKCINK